MLEMQWKTKALFLPWAIFHFYSVYSNYSLPKSQLNFNCAEMEISKANLYSFLVAQYALSNLNRQMKKKEKKNNKCVSAPVSGKALPFAAINLLWCTTGLRELRKREESPPAAL